MKLVEIAFFTNNVEQTADFYRRLLNLDPVAQSEGMAIFLVGETKIFIHHNYTPSEGDLPPENHIAFAAEDLETTCNRLVEQGLTLEVPPRDFYWGRSAYLRDPGGRLIEIIQDNDRGE
jgi:catechol 2,3-dioxygenase-like lactoylglutathione lyase family enzyme